MRSLIFCLSLALAPFAAGCARHYIPNTDVEETDLNRKVIEFCEQYRNAVELRNVALLLKFADPKYYEDGGSVDTSDDLDYAGLKAFLEDKFKKSKAIRYEIRYRNVTAGRRNSILVDYTYTASYKVPTGLGESDGEGAVGGGSGGDVWRREVADNRLELVPKGESFKILGGM
jgi:hypothetical protein